VSIARAFLKNPPLLLLDEATSALDSATERAVHQAMKTLSKDRTTLMIAHRLSTVSDAHKIVVLGRTGVLEEGTHDELLRRPGSAYASMWAHQRAVATIDDVVADRDPAAGAAAKAA